MTCTRGTAGPKHAQLPPQLSPPFIVEPYLLQLPAMALKKSIKNFHTVHRKLQKPHYRFLTVLMAQRKQHESIDTRGKALVHSY